MPEEAEIWKEKERFARVKFSSEVVNTLLDEWEGLRSGCTARFTIPDPPLF